MEVKPKRMKNINPQTPLEQGIPMEVVPKPLTDILRKKTSYPEQSNLESEESDSDESEPESVDFMPDNPEDLKKCFRQLFYKLHDNIYIYKKLVHILDELKRMSCLTKEECDFMNKHLQKEIGK